MKPNPNLLIMEAIVRCSSAGLRFTPRFVADSNGMRGNTWKIRRTCFEMARAGMLDLEKKHGEVYFSGRTNGDA
jgi:hypothetical protein